MHALCIRYFRLHSSNSLCEVTRHLIRFGRSLTLNQLRSLAQFLRHTLLSNSRVLRPECVESRATWILTKPPDLCDPG